MKQKTAWLLLLAFITGISLSGCASMQEWCGPKKEKAVAVESQPEVKPAPQRQPEPPKPVPPPKKDRN